MTLALDRAAAWRLLCEWTQSDSLRKHALAVEAAMRYYARRFGEDETLWGITGLLHDLDYERHPTPEEHPARGVAALAEAGYPAVMLEAIQGHAPYLGVPRRTRMAKALYAVDELTGLIIAVALVRPSRKLADVEVRSVLKKFKDKGFARGCNREEILQAAEEFGVPWEEHVGHVLKALQENAAALGL
ncbi:MAG TPA: HDIG domain-containing protein [Limnochordia bacterium]